MKKSRSALEKQINDLKWIQRGLLFIFDHLGVHVILDKDGNIRWSLPKTDWFEIKKSETLEEE